MNFSAKDRDMQIAAVEALAEYDHCFISKEGVAHFTSPFGFSGTTYKAKANPEAPKGLTMSDGADEAEGQDAAELAGEICRHLGVAYPPMMGRGGKLASRCSALLAHLKA